MGSSLPRVPDSRQLECKKETRPLMESNEVGVGGKGEGLLKGNSATDRKSIFSIQYLDI